MRGAAGNSSPYRDCSFSFFSASPRRCASHIFKICDNPFESVSSAFCSIRFKELLGKPAMNPKHQEFGVRWLATAFTLIRCGVRQTERKERESSAKSEQSKNSSSKFIREIRVIRGPKFPVKTMATKMGALSLWLLVFFVAIPPFTCLCDSNQKRPPSV